MSEQIMQPQLTAEAPPAAPAEFPCSPQQHQAWLIDRARPGDPSLNVTARWRLEGEVSPDLLERSLQALVDRHEALRTGFAERDGLPVQRVLPRARFRLRVVDLGELPEEARAEEAMRLGREEARRPFDLARPPLLRMTMLRHDRVTAELLVTTHQAVGDCWSNGILASELGDIYEALLEGRAPELPELPLHYGNYAEWHEAWMEAGGAAEAEAYWRRRLASLPAFHLPTDRPARADAPKQAGLVSSLVPRRLSDAATAAARQHGTTFFTFGAAALAVALHRWTGAPEVVLATQVAGREEVELEGVVGAFINSIVLRCDLAGDPAFATVLDAMRLTVGEALEHAQAPAEHLARTLPLPDPGLRRNPWDAVNFLVQRAFARDADYAAFAIKGQPHHPPGAKHDLSVFLVERPSGWRASCEYDADLFDEATAQWLLRSFLQVLDAAAAAPARRLSDLAAETGEAPRPAPSPTRTPAPPASEAPMSATEAKLAPIWAEVLGNAATRPTDNFFESGGESVRAARLCQRIAATFGTRISLAQLFRAPTLRALAALLEPGQATAEAPLPEGVVPVQPLGSRPPLFAINNTGIFHTLSRRLGEDQPLLAIQAIDQDSPPHLHPQDFREIAARYVAAIRSVQPHGPYPLIGLCAAGKLAFEIAQQLRAAGEAVPVLAVVDSWAPGHFRRMRRRQALLAKANLRASRLGRQFQRIAEGTLTVGGFLANRAAVRGLRNAAFAAARRLGLRDSVPAGVQTNLFTDYLDGASRRYEPKPYDGRVLVFHGPEQPTGRFLDPSFGWREIVTGGVEVVALPADGHAKFEDHHQGLFQDPGAGIMAEHIRAALA